VADILETLQAEPAGRPQIEFGNANAGGVTSRAWHHTPIESNWKRWLIVNRNPASAATSGHGGILHADYRGVYWNVTLQALGTNLTFNRPYVPIVERYSNGVVKYQVGGTPPSPAAFVWDCEFFQSLSTTAGSELVGISALAWVPPYADCP
jgi:hypothetical protein